MAHIKQRAHKNTWNLVMKPTLTPKPPLKPQADRKVIIEFSSDKSLDEENPQQMQEYSMPKRVKKRIHLTLPTSPKHITTTEAFTTFFINHRLTKALRKAFEKCGWTTDQMQELITNFQHKHGKNFPLPKIYADEDSSDSEGLELDNGPRVGRKMPAGGKPGRKPSTGGGGGGTGLILGTSKGGGSGGGSSTGGGGIGGSRANPPGGGDGGCRQCGKCGHKDDDNEDDPNKKQKTDTPPSPRPPHINPARKELRKFGPQYVEPGVRHRATHPSLTEIYLLSM